MGLASALKLASINVLGGIGVIWVGRRPAEDADDPGEPHPDHEGSANEGPLTVRRPMAGLSSQSGSEYGIPSSRQTIIAQASRIRRLPRAVEPSGVSAVEGADWEWWIGSAGGWVRIRVQAKRLHRDQQSYKEIAYVQRNGTRQIDLLIDRAHARQRYAFYCLYNAWDIPGPLLPWNCRSFQPMPQLLGCSLAAAPKVRDLIDQGVGNVQDFGPIMFPWSCLVCCTGYAPQTASLAQRASAFLQNKYGDEIPNVDMIHREPSLYVSDLINGEPPIGFDEPGIGYILVVNED